MFHNIESHANNIHENTSAIVDNLIEFILRNYYFLQEEAGKRIGSLLERSNQVSVEVKFDGEQVYAKQGDDEPTVNQLTPSQVEELKAALENPKLVTGSVSILINKELILHIENGQVLQDELGLITTQRESSLDIISKTEPDIERGESITQAGSLLIASYGYQVSEGVSAFHGHSYYYEQSDESFSIRAYDRGTIFCDGEFTSSATEQDIQTLKDLPQKVEQQLSESQQQQQTSKQSAVLKR